MNATVELLREGGVQAAAPAAIVERAGAGKMTLYRHFQGKGELVTEALRWFIPDQQLDLLGPHDDKTPRERVLDIFDRLTAYGDAQVLTPCVYITTSLETGRNHPVAEVTRDYKAEIARELAQDLTAMNHPSPEVTARVIQTLIDGAVVHAVINGDGRPIREARAAAELLLDQ
jgi:AcrR family transcriptional regulator